MSDITLTVIYGEALADWILEPPEIEATVATTQVTVTPISGILNPPIDDDDIAVGADISAYKIDQDELNTIVDARTANTLAQIQSDLNALDSTVDSIINDTTNFVRTDGDQVVGGNKVFSSAVSAADPINLSHLVTLNYLTDQLPGKIWVSTNAPTDTDGASGDFWFQYVG